MSIEDDKQWDKFKLQHHCKMTAFIQGDLTNGLGISYKGYPTVTLNYNSAKDGWTCDDGITYFRDEE